MNMAEISVLCAYLAFFALGGLVGSMRTMWRLLGLDHCRLPWRTRLRFYHFFGDDEILLRRATQADQDSREVYAIILMTVLSDLGGPGPWPRSKQALENVLAEAERRFQAKMRG
jgi:hypothetical protein